jgi:hypothetical protein
MKSMSLLFFVVCFLSIGCAHHNDRREASDGQPVKLREQWDISPRGR